MHFDEKNDLKHLEKGIDHLNVALTCFDQVKNKGIGEIPVAIIENIILIGNRVLYGMEGKQCKFQK